jgi:hypothetical protein
MNRTQPPSDDVRRLVPAADPGVFSHAELRGLPPTVQQHLAGAIATGTRLAPAAYLLMRGRIKIGAWLPFRAREVLSPHVGLVWSARAAGIISGSDRYIDRAGRSDWTLAGLRTLAHAEGPDVTRSAAGRVGAEALWVPTALLPRFGVRWTAPDRGRATSSLTVDGVEVSTHYRLDDGGRIISFVFDRWGDPDNTGTWGWHPFGGEVLGYRTFGGLTIPAAGRVGWFFETDRWPTTASFHYRITQLHLVADPGQLTARM